MDEGSNIVTRLGITISMMKEKPTNMSDELKPNKGRSQRNWQEPVLGVSNVTAIEKNRNQESEELMEQVTARENMLQAYRRVMSNKGAAGIDGMEVEELLPYLQRHWKHIKETLLRGDYKPQAVRAIYIGKADGGNRQLGIPTVTDRLIQQAISQVLSPYFEGNFSEWSYGFRPGRSTHQAVKQAQEYARAGRRFVVDIDIEKFFDRVNHDILMSRVARKVRDKRLLHLIRRYLQAGIMEAGIVRVPREGTPQGSPLSPLLSNILLDDLDKELESRGHKFVRYADDCNIYVTSRRAGERVMASVTKYLEKHLRLKVNTKKSAIACVWQRNFLGYSMTKESTPRLSVSGSSVKRLKDKIRVKFRQWRGYSVVRAIKELSVLLRGWKLYFRLAETKRTFEELEGWIRRKLRCLQWQHWKHPRRRMKELMERGVDKQKAIEFAFNGRGSWFNSQLPPMSKAMPNKLFDSLGLVNLTDRFS